MTSYELAQELKEKVRIERVAINDVLGLISLALETRAYVELGFASMFDWLTREFGYSNGAAQRRIDAARLMRSVPKVAEQLKSGVVNLTTLSQAQTVIRAQEKISGRRISSTDKAQVVERIQNKSSQEAGRILFSLFPETASTVHQERRIVVNETTTRHSMNLPLKVTEDLDRAKEVLSHQLPNASDAEILAYALKRLLDRMDPLRKSLAKERHNTRSLAKGSIAQLSSQVEKEENFKAPKQQQHAVPSGVAVKATTGSASNLNRNEKNQTGGVGLGKLLTKLSKARTRYIVLQKSNGRCTYRDPVTGKICGSRYQIQSDHIIPRALGGTDHPSNLRALCRGHNLLVAEQKLGKRLMDQYRRST